MKNTNKNWSNYLSNPNVRPKTYHVELNRDADGYFHIAAVDVVKIVNQYTTRAEEVDVNAFAEVLNRHGISA